MRRLSLAAALLVLGVTGVFAQDATLPELTAPVNDFAHVIDPASTASMSQMIRSLQAASGDVVVVATIPTFEPYGDIREYAVKLFENHGKGIGQKGKDNGLLILVAVKEHRAWIEVGYGLEPIITDGFSGETTRNYMIPEFRQGRYGAGLRAGTARIIGRIADDRKITLQDVPPVPPQRRAQPSTGLPIWAIILIFVVILIISRAGGGPGAGFRGPRYWGGPFGGWTSGVGPFGGGFGGGGGGGGFGGGFGGFGGGSSGGGGGGGSW